VQVQLVVVAIGWTLGWWLLAKVPRLGQAHAAPGASSSRDVSVVIPARDEATTLPSLLASLHRQDERPREVIVVDDRSSDSTASVARVHGATVVAGAPLPAGWNGKPWACDQGSRAAQGEVLVFLDADVTLAPGALTALTTELATYQGLLSVQPFHTMERVVERGSAFFNLVSMMGVGAATPGRGGRSRGAFGPVLACRREDYTAIGGHAAVRGAVAEDLALAGEFTRAGLPVHVVGGGPLATFRMYRGLRSMVDGWSKNLATGARSVGMLRALLVAWWVTAVLVSVQVLADALVAAASGVQQELAVGIAVYGIVVMQLRVQLGQLGNFGWRSAVAYPVLALFFVAVFVRSAWWTFVLRRVRWRGRTISLRRAPHRPRSPGVS
jgi:4,4'-diaponeurosporenoate glycosyltransferase